MQKVRSHLVFKLRFLLLIELPVQDLFTSYLLSFQRSLTVLFTIAQYIIFSLRGWFPYIQTSYLSSYLLFLVSPHYAGLIFFITGLSPSMVCHSKQIIISFSRFKDFRLRNSLKNRLTRFRSPLLTGSRLISFPSTT